jgi:glutamate formiminotransferase/formiminotetrahydrofolate cyclodeaminase
MVQPIVECIANYSEARRPQVVEAISQAIRSVPGVRLLDRHSDLDHNRTVLTFVGDPQGVEEAAFRSIAKAAELIDLDVHQGAHPRIGAADVVPFVPISGIDMPACVELARRLGRRVGQELGIAVYLYEEAATRPDRQNLENLRRGQYEGLKAEIQANPDRLPDFGPARLTPAGATVIGARHPLIAYNVYLNTDDVSVAKKIAKAVRASSGGLRYVKALGLLVEGRAQVSMNLTNYRETPIGRVVEFVRREAQRYGVGLHHCELVGLIPQEALVDAAVWYLQLDQFDADQILERQLYAAGPAETSGPSGMETAPAFGAGPFLDALAAGTVAPAGGSAAAFSGAAAAALVAMVARLTLGKPKYASAEVEMQAVLQRAESLRVALSQGIVRDAGAFKVVMDAYTLPKDTPEQQAYRLAAVEAALLTAAQEPLLTARLSLQTMQLALQAVKVGNLNAISDAGTAAILARAALSGAGLSIRANLKQLAVFSTTHEPAAVSSIRAELVALEAQAAEVEQAVRVALRQRSELAFL